MFVSCFCVNVTNAVVSSPCYQSAFQAIRLLGIRRASHPAVHHHPHSGWSLDGYPGKPGENNLWESGCHTSTISLDNELLSTRVLLTKRRKGSSRPSTALACAPNYTFSCVLVSKACPFDQLWCVLVVTLDMYLTRAQVMLPFISGCLIALPPAPLSTSSTLPKVTLHFIVACDEAVQTNSKIWCV